MKLWPTDPYAGLECTVRCALEHLSREWWRAGSSVQIMAAGRPRRRCAGSSAANVVASDFPLWRGIVESSGCGICVDPADPQAVAGALRRLLDDPQAARACGEAGRAAVRATYNWPSAERVLLALYAELLP